MKYLLLILFYSSVSMASYDTVEKACQSQVTYDLHDYEYGTDERTLYSNRHFEACSNLKRIITEACRKFPKNIPQARAIHEISCKRGSKGEAKLLFNNGKLTYLISYPGHSEELIKEALEKKVGFTFKAEVVPSKKEEAVKKVEKSFADRDKKIADNTNWFKAEVQKLTAKPGPDLSEKLEKLTEEYKKRTDEILKSP